MALFRFGDTRPLLGLGPPVPPAILWFLVPFLHQRMASLPTSGLDAPINLKVIYDGATRRAKMPLREMAPKLLEEQVRAFLHISDDTKIMIERYSDSASAYVMLDSSNLSVYKQLFRAAKAKSKLKLRVSALRGEAPTSGARFVAPVKPSPKQVPLEPLPKPETPPMAEKPMASQPQNTPSDSNEMERKASEEAFPATVSAPTPAAASEISLPFRCSGPATVSSPTRITGPNPSFQTYLKENKDLLLRLDRLGKGPGPDTKATQPPIVPDQTETKYQAPRNVEQFNKPTKAAVGCGFAVCCNGCQKNISDVHFHCSTCDDGDFDLCPACLDKGATCYVADHWLIRRVIHGGQIVHSTSMILPTKPKLKASVLSAKAEIERTIEQRVKAEEVKPRLTPQNPASWERPSIRSCQRTCNCCVKVLPEKQFLHCTSCKDYDVCLPCFVVGQHGHHPNHEFVQVSNSITVPETVKPKMAPGRGQAHHAICDGCDEYIVGVRNKCLDCPDWDFCSSCMVNASASHPGHRFVPIYEPLEQVKLTQDDMAVHYGICCDGPLCSSNQACPAYIMGIRYKCAVCHDLDYCASCEASPLNDHNATHPLIKFKTPIRHVNVTTTGEHPDGKRMPVMGDRSPSPPPKIIEAPMSPPVNNSINVAQTVMDVKPTESLSATEQSEKLNISTPAPRSEVKPALITQASLIEANLEAEFVRDSIRDGTIMPPNQDFEQTWVLRNSGDYDWPAGCRIRFVGGDYMGLADSAHPASMSELASASESSICQAVIEPGEEYSFTCRLRTPARSGKIVSYWRLTTESGIKFGHRLWCEVNVHVAAGAPAKPSHALNATDKVALEECPKTTVGAMIFPKLDGGSETLSPQPKSVDDADGTSSKTCTAGEAEFDDCSQDDEWDESEEFLTDEEYDILDASDEEFLEEHQKQVGKQ
ncbi:hypothetical protein CDD82_4086 [Ophiocordyceps australis]|uniref:ZZ-type domain-containing protein n=1 Tax=Ophiocordyceps australis TaxID=1399860 RepID=A0A2C5ZSZ4_9HYPO|nr:hypothetical protein CDD82_4086 [Ophiocordyceps australis]